MASTFYSQISANKRNSFLLGLGLVALLAALGLTLGYGLTGSVSGAVATTIFAVVVGAVASLASYYAGDSLVLAASGARELDPQRSPQLFNIVRELTIAANVPMPRVYLIDDTSINAFATGRDPEHASIAVTTGLLTRLDREAIQGVIGHELSHVRNFDIRFALLVGVIVGSIALLADFFLRFTFWGGGRSSSRDRGGGGLQLVALAVGLVLAILAPIAARMVQLAVSREREYLADASAVELTRNPVGLERALATIAGDTEVLEAANRATQHLYFTNPIMKLGSRGEDASAWFSTHPRIVDRINRLRSLRGAGPVGSPSDELVGGLGA